MKYYPKVLIIIKTRINDKDSVGASLRNWFNDWPKMNIAQIYSGGIERSSDYCNTSYELGGNDRRFGKLFSLVKRSSLGVFSRQAQEENSSQQKNIIRDTCKIFFHFLSKYLTKTGFWELLFDLRVSPELLRWIKEFDPDVMYIQPTDLTFMRLALRINKDLNIPICLHISDDWPNHIYKQLPSSYIIRPIIERTFRELCAKSHLKLGTSDKMKNEYLKRYGYRFEPLFLCDESSRFNNAIAERVAPDDTISVVYSGSLDLNRWMCLVDLSKAATSLSNSGKNYEIYAFVPFVPQEAKSKLKEFFNIRIYPPLPNDQVPRIFKGADILFLPESFDDEYRSYISLSISTKAHLYMMSKRPILVYGPPEVGVVTYARFDGWGYVVDRQDVGLVADALEKLSSNSEQCRSLIQRGKQIATLNHEATVVREMFRNILAMSNTEVTT